MKWLLHDSVVSREHQLITVQKSSEIIAQLQITMINRNGNSNVHRYFREHFQMNEQQHMFANYAKIYYAYTYTFTYNSYVTYIYIYIFIYLIVFS